MKPKPEPDMRLNQDSLEPDPDEDVETLLSLPAPNPLSELLSEPERRRRSGVKWIAGSGALIVIGLSGWLGYRSFLQTPVEPLAVPTIPAQVDSIEVTVTEAGTVELDGQQTFKSPSDVTVGAVEVQERQRVTAGTVLLLLKDRDLERQLDTQQVENQKANNTLIRKREVVQEQKNKLQLAQKRFQDLQSLFDRGFISEDAYRQDQQSVEDAFSTLKDAQVELTNAELDIQNNQLTLENVRTQLADNQIVSPIDAVVLNVDVKSGDGVT